MRTKLTTKRPWNLSPSELRQCWSLNYGTEGSLQHTFRDILKSDNNTYVESWAYLIKDLDGKVLSWALVYEIDNRPYWEAQFWTRRSHRRLGYASRLVRAIQKDWPSRVQVMPHEEVSRSFFNKTTRGRRGGSSI